ncbi:MAG: phosphonate ABC transporter ATP-binding protein [Opitutales bacterium]
MLVVENLSKTLPDGCCLLDGVSFTICKGEFVGILGASGAGKSLTLRCILGLTSADCGTARFTTRGDQTFDTLQSRGRSLREARRRIGVIFQGYNLVRRLTVLENVMLGKLAGIHPMRSWLYGFTDAEAFEAYEALERVGMEAFASRRTGSLSGGEMQRVAIARAINQKPDLYLADEPISSLDPKNARAVMKLLAPLARETPVLGVFHQPDMVAKYCTRAIGLKNGKILHDGSSQLSHRQLVDIYGEELAEITGQPAPAETSEPARQMAGSATAS